MYGCNVNINIIVYCVETAEVCNMIDFIGSNAVVVPPSVILTGSVTVIGQTALNDRG